jgi:hypothetical protein
MNGKIHGRKNRPNSGFDPKEPRPYNGHPAPLRHMTKVDYPEKWVFPLQGKYALQASKKG